MIEFLYNSTTNYQPDFKKLSGSKIFQHCQKNRCLKEMINLVIVYE